MHKIDVHEAFHQKCEVNGPCVGGSGPRAGPLYNEDIYNFRIFYSLYLYVQPEGIN